MENLVVQIMQSLVGGLLPTAGNVQRNVVGSAVIAVLVMTAYLALVMACWFTADATYGPAWASLIVAAGSIIVALIAWAVVTVLNKQARERARTEAAKAAALRRETDLSAQLLGAAASAVPGMIRESPVATVIAVTGLAYALMKSVGKR